MKKYTLLFLSLIVSCFWGAKANAQCAPSTGESYCYGSAESGPFFSMCADPVTGDAVSVTFTSGTVANWDQLQIYSGPNGDNSDPSIAALGDIFSFIPLTGLSFTGNAGECLTMEFLTDTGGSCAESTVPAAVFDVACVTAGCSSDPAASNYHPAPDVEIPCTYAGDFDHIATGTQTITGCGPGNFYDTGGSNGNYGADEDGTSIICPSDPVNEVIEITFNEFNTEEDWDGLFIYNGDSTSEPLLDSGHTATNGGLGAGSFTGPGANPGTITAINPSGCLTFNFYSDGGTRAGWSGFYQCVARPMCNDPINGLTSNVTINSADLAWESNNADVTGHTWDVETGLVGFTPGTGAEVDAQTGLSVLTASVAALTSNTDYEFYVLETCDGSDGASNWGGPFAFSTLPDYCGGDLLIDNGGAGGNYSNNAFDVVTICPDVDGEVVALSFTEFNTEPGFDFVTIFDADTNDAAAEVAELDGDLTDNLPGPFVATNATGCLTVEFDSDGSATRAGYVANAVCVVPPILTNDQTDPAVADNYDTSGAPSIFDPCSCLTPTMIEDGVVTTIGTFAEELDIFAVTPNSMWMVTEGTGLTVTSTGGDTFTDNGVVGILDAGDIITDNGDGVIQITGTHEDAEDNPNGGYSVTLTDGLFTLSQENACSQPRPSVTDLGLSYCTNGIPLELEATDDLLSTSDDIVFDIAGPTTLNDVTELDPSLLDPGSYTLTVTFNGDDLPSSDTPTNVGCPVISSFTFEVTAAPQALACNDLVQVSLGDACSVTLTADHLLEGADGCDPSYDVQVMSSQGAALGSVVDASFLDNEWTVQVIELSTGNYCWGSIVVEDKIAPVIDCDCPTPLDAADFTLIGTRDGQDYFVSTSTAFWTDAINTAIAAGGNLVSINNQEENDFLVAAAATAPQLASPNDRFWIGLTDNEVFGGTEAGLDPINGWVWANGDAFDFQNWNAGEPNDGGNGGSDEDFIELLMSSGEWNDIGNIQRFFVIERPTTEGCTFECTELEGVLDGSIAADIPTATDNCSTIVPELLGQEVVYGECTDAFSAQITRTWVATDASGNSAQCEQVLTFVRPDIADVEIPADITIDCADYDADASVIEPNNDGAGYPSLGGEAIENGSSCNITATQVGEDVLIEDICEGSFKIRRKWLVIDWCTGDEREENQLIKVLDTAGPELQGGADQLDESIPATTADEADPNAPHAVCTGCVQLPALAWTDDCSNVDGYTTSVFNTDGELVSTVSTNGGLLCNLALYTEISNTPSYTVVYTATDGCGNSTTHTEVFMTEDRVAPTCILDEVTQVSIGNADFDQDGLNEALLQAGVFDDGSYDNCTDVHFLVDRVSDTAPSMNAYQFTFNFASTNRYYTEVEAFDCSDIDETVNVFVMVIDDFMYNALNDNDGFTPSFTPYLSFLAPVVPEGYPFIQLSPDFLDFYEGHFNICMVEVLVEDKIAPVVTCDMTIPAITCTSYFNNYQATLDILAEDAANDNIHPDALNAIFDEALVTAPTVTDNCGFTTDLSWDYDVDNCGNGTITRTWSNIEDNSGNSWNGTCVQTIEVNHENNWSITFPEDKDWECDEDSEDLGEPEVFEDNCELIAISMEDQLFNIVPDACYKIFRTYTAINWCVYNGNESSAVNVGAPAGTNDDSNIATRRYADGGDGIVVYRQVIKVQDFEAPVITLGDDVDGCITGPTSSGEVCKKDVVVNPVSVTDCDNNGSDIVITYTLYTIADVELNSTETTSATDVGRTYSDLDLGDYKVIITAMDNCGNQSSVEYLFSVTDCKAPTPYCVGSLVVELMPIDTDGDGVSDAGMVELWSTDFNAGSFDNCTDSIGLKYTMTHGIENFAESTANWEFDCGSLTEGNDLDIYLFVEDEAENVDYCLTTLVLESVDNVCPEDDTEEPDELNVAGALATENDAPVAGVTVELNNGSASTSNAEGEYSLNATTGADVTVTPMYDVYDNSVTTYDLVIIRQHILTTSLLNSPYKVIAADVNNSGAVTGADIIAAKKVILGIETTYPNNNAWTFVDANYTFASDWNLATDGYPAVTSINNIAQDEIADFVAVRIGDVNGTYGFADDADERNSFNINANDAKLVAGQEYTVEFTASDYAALGYQFTLNFTNLEVVSIDGNTEDFGIFANAITTSYNGEKEGDKLFAVTFKATTNVTVSEVLDITSNITKAEAYNTNGAAMPVVLEFNNSDSDFALYQNSPNPFAGRTVVGFSLPTASAATLTITDISGKVLSVIKGEYTTGYNEVSISNLDATGVLYYQLDTPTNSAVRKMVVID